MAGKAFFTVHCPDDAPPYKTHGSAMREADRLSKRNPGKRFFVMRTCSRPLVAEPGHPGRGTEGV